MDKNEWINHIAQSDNEIGKIYRAGDEYIIEINMWNADIRILKTVNCRKIIHNIEFRDEIGSVLRDNTTFRFMTVDNDDTLLEVVADDIIHIGHIPFCKTE